MGVHEQLLRLYVERLKDVPDINRPGSRSRRLQLL